MKKYITITHDDKNDYRDYYLLGEVPEKLYILSLLVKNFYPDYFFSNKFIKEEKPQTNNFVIVQKKDDNVTITARKEYQRKESDTFIMTFEHFMTMAEDWLFRFDGNARRIFFILEDNNEIDVQGDGLGWSPDQEENEEEKIIN